MAEAKNPDVRTLAVRVSPDFHALLTMVANVDEISLTDLMMKALESYVDARRQAEDFQTKVQAALAEEQARMARTQALLLGTTPTEGSGGAATSSPTTGRGRRKDEASG